MDFLTLLATTASGALIVGTIAAIAAERREKKRGKR